MWRVWFTLYVVFAFAGQKIMADDLARRCAPRNPFPVEVLTAVLWPVSLGLVAWAPKIDRCTR